MKKRVLGIALMTLFCLVSIASATDFSGAYVFKSTKATINLSLSQDSAGKISGLLSSTTGAKFQVIGRSQGDVATGQCRVGKKGAPFEAHFEKGLLLFTLISQKKGKNTVIAFHPVPKKRPLPKAKIQPPASNGNGALDFGKAQKPPLQKPRATTPSLLGKWICRTANGNLYLHFLSSNRLTFNGEAASYTATADRITVQADGQTFVYPYFFNRQGLVITFPNGAKALFVKDTGQARANPATGKVFPELVGRWKDIRSSGHTIIVLMGDGRYNYYSDYAAGNSAQGQTNWEYGNSANDRGSWRAQGTPAAGTIYYTSQDGSSGTLSYQVHVENGQTYWREYYFDGKLYVKQ